MESASNEIKPKVIVTGKSGMVGHAFEQAFGERWDLVSLDRTDGQDILDRTSLQKFFDSHQDTVAVIHLAAFTNVSAAHQERNQLEGLCFQLNVVGTQNIVEICRTRGLPLIHFSTDFVFDGRREDTYTEDHSPHPVEWYGQTKWLAEQAARAWEKTVALRISFPFGPDPLPKKDLVRFVRDKLVAGEGVKMFTDQIITPTYLPDLARGTELVLKQMTDAEKSAEVFGQLMHAVGSTSLSPYQLAQEVARAWELNTDLIEESCLEEFLKQDPRPRQQRLIIDNTRWSEFMRAAGEAPPKTIAQALDEMAEHCGV